MSDLFIHSKKLSSVFELLGLKENSITYSLGWAFSRSPFFLHSFLRQIAPALHKRITVEKISIHLQQYGSDKGYTDIELAGADFHYIIEAKRGWHLPSLQQLRRYLPRFPRSKDIQKRIITLSECSATFARQKLPESLSGIPIRHFSWSEVVGLTSGIRCSHAEKRLLSELRTYLEKFVTMQNQESNWVYVVSLSNFEWFRGLTFIDVVEKRRKYFHPYGVRGWPKEAPNYIGFRYHGQLQSIHHIKKAEVITSFRPHIPEYPQKKVAPHFLYQLGPAIRPQSGVKTGGNIRSMRLWAMLDLLLTSKTILEARDLSKSRTSNALA